jgi:lipid-A-disaccharide synthase-like uncharacterized protein
MAFSDIIIGWFKSFFPEIATPTEIAWEIVGLVGHFFFFSRFVIQWIATERQKRTVIPEAFWYLSLVGTVIVLVYSLHVGRPVFMLAYSLNIVFYVRNLIIHRRAARAA